MSAKQDFGVMDRSHLRMVDGLEALLLQAVHLLAVVHNVAEAVKVVGLRQLLFSLADGTDHTGAETALFIDGNLHHLSIASIAH